MSFCLTVRVRVCSSACDSTLERVWRDREACDYVCMPPVSWVGSTLLVSSTGPGLRLTQLYLIGAANRMKQYKEFVTRPLSTFYVSINVHVAEGCVHPRRTSLQPTNQPTNAMRNNNKDDLAPLVPSSPLLVLTGSAASICVRRLPSRYSLFACSSPVHTV
jgi:hypothetical protein